MSNDVQQWQTPQTPKARQLLHCGGHWLRPLDHQPVLQWDAHGFLQEWCDKARAQGTGTYRGFHGSPMANWHSVLRAGLRCSPQGALGPGVYAHETAVYSRTGGGQRSERSSSVVLAGPGVQGYMGTAPVGVWRNSLFSPDPRAMSMMALVEIADLRHDRKLINHSAGVTL